jgi:Flp pilus assembly protein TadD
MILNNTKLSLVAFMVVLSTTLAGCSSMPTFSSGEAEKAQGNETSSAAKVQADKSEVDDVEALSTPVQLTPEKLEEQALETKARTLMGSINVFKLDKEKQTKLNSGQLRDVQSAVNQLANGKPDQALDAVNRVIDDPDFMAAPNTAVWVLRGDVHRAKGQNKKAIVDYKTALKLVSSNYQAHNRIGLIYRDAGEFDLAKVHYTQAIDAWPGNADSYRNRGILYDLYVGDKAAALADYKIYKSLLDFQIQSVEAAPKSLLREQKLTSQWILDIERQIKTLEREQANG